MYRDWRVFLSNKKWMFFYSEFFGLFSRHYLLKWLQLHFLCNVAKVVLNSSSKKIENIFAESKSPVDSVYKNKNWVIEICSRVLHNRSCTTWLSCLSCTYRAILLVEYKWSIFLEQAFPLFKFSVVLLQPKYLLFEVHSLLKCLLYWTLP